MNNKRRKEIQRIIDLLTTANMYIEQLRDDEEESRDNIPEGLTDKYDASDEALSALDEANTQIVDIIEYLQAAQGEQ